jgi:putative superfamily III holin-X
MAYSDTNRLIPAIFADLVNQFTALLRKEGQLARAEMSGKIGKIGTALGLVVGGAVLLIPALVILLLAAVAGLAAEGLRLVGPV